MSMSLRDQLLAAGLGTKKQAKEATQAKRPPSRHQPAPPISPEKAAANKAQAAKNARDQELNRQPSSSCRNVTEKPSHSAPDAITAMSARSSRRNDIAIGQWL